MARGYAEETAEEKLREIREMAIEIVDVDWNLTRHAATFKAKGKIAHRRWFPNWSLGTSEQRAGDMRRLFTLLYVICR